MTQTLEEYCRILNMVTVNTCELVRDVTPNFTRLALDALLMELFNESLLFDLKREDPLTLPGREGGDTAARETLCKGANNPYLILQLKYLEIHSNIYIIF